MPIPDEMVERVHASKIADLLQHDWIRWGGGLYAAAFLREFTGGRALGAPRHRRPRRSTPAAPYGHVTPGGTGFAVATLVEYARGLTLPADA